MGHLKRRIGKRHTPCFFEDAQTNGKYREEALLLVQKEQQAADSENRLYIGKPGFAETGGTVRITGYIRDHLNGEPVSGITVMTEDKKHYTLSDT